MPTGDLIRALVFVGVVALIYLLAARYMVLAIRWRREGYEPSARTRRLRTISLTLASAGVICGLYAYFVEPYRPAVTHVSIRSARIKPGSSLRIVHISDLHCEAQPRLEERLPALIAAEKPDVIVFTGDTLNTKQGLPTARKLFSALAAIAPVYAVRGNWDNMLDVDVFGGTGVHELRRESAALEVRGNHIDVLGAENGSAAFLAPLARSVPNNWFHLLLYHRPDQIENVAQVGNVDLYCAGHTHGGQVALPWFGAIVTLTKTGKKYESGLYRVGNTYLYVNRGVGMEGGLPVRFFARPEITVIEVRSAG